MEEFKLIQKNVDKLQEYWDTMLNESSIPQRLDLECRKKYIIKMANAIEGINGLVSQKEISNETAERCLFSITEFCMETMKLLFRPMLELLRKESYYNKSAL